MKIELPQKFTYTDKNLRGYAYVKNYVLHIYGPVNFEKLMYTITYALRKNKCYYCGIGLDSKNLTLDHKFPRKYGGITIPNNLVPCCKNCNRKKKRDMTENQYIRWRNLVSKNRKESYYKEAMKKNRKTIAKKKFVLPQSWVRDYDITKVAKRIDFSETSGYKKISVYYEEHGMYPNPIIVTSDDWVYEDINIIRHAQKHGITLVPAIVLDNVQKNR